MAGIGDLGLRAYPHLRAAIDRASAEHAPAAVLLHRLPLLSDADRRPCEAAAGNCPWCWISRTRGFPAYGATRPTLSKEGLAHRLAVMLEPRALRHADFVTVGFTDPERRDGAPVIPGSTGAAWRPSPSAATRRISRVPARHRKDRPKATCIELRYIGAFWPRAEPAVRQLMKGLAGFCRATQPQLAARLRLSFTGTSRAACRASIRPVRWPPSPQQEGVGDLVREVAAAGSVRRGPAA